MINRIAAPAGLVGMLIMSGCGPRLVPIMENGELLPERADVEIAQAQVDGSFERARIYDSAAATSAEALATCAPDVCDGIARGELALGMTEAQVLAATRTSYDAWSVRPSAGASVLTPANPARAPRDATGAVALVSLQSGRVASYTYQEPNGFRMVSTAMDATPAGRANARADALLEQGDAFAAAGQLDLALDRYDRADVIRPNDSGTNLRIASTLDKQLRPIEALLRYQLFIHQLELEKIEARGEAAARMAEAIARARERVIILDRQ